LDAEARPEKMNAQPRKNVFAGMLMRWNLLKESVISLAYSVMRIFSYGAIPPRGCGGNKNAKIAPVFA
jgi:hypothetical protein